MEYFPMYHNNFESMADTTPTSSGTLEGGK